MSHKTHAWLLVYLLVAIISIALLWRACNQLSQLVFLVGVTLFILALVGLLYAVLRLWIDLRQRALDNQARLHRIQLEAEAQSASHAREAARVKMEYRARERQAEIDYLRFELESHLALTRVPPTEHGYAAILDEEVRYTQIPYQGKVAMLPQPKGERGGGMMVDGSDRQGQHGQQGQESDEPPLSPQSLPLPATLDFAEVLRTWQPSVEEIFLFNTVEGAIYESMEATCHIGLAGSTGGGKTNTFRLILAQLLACGADVYLANPNFAPIKLNGRTIEDWRPIVAAMRHQVAWQIEDIKMLVRTAILRLDERRLRQQVSPLRGRDIYLALGEWPAIQSRWKEAAIPISQLLRESRQYGIHLVSEFQDALVKTLGVGSGVRECFRNAYYFGGDATTARTLLDLQGKGPLDESGLGKLGASLFRSNASPAVRGRVPFLSNQALYMLLGYPPNPLPDRLPQGVDPVEFFSDYGIPVGDIDGTGGDHRDAPRSGTTSGVGRVYGTAVPSHLRDGETPGTVEAAPTPAEAGQFESWQGQPETTAGRASRSSPHPVPPASHIPSIPVSLHHATPDLGRDDRAFTTEQAEEFLRRYQRTPDIKACLRQMNGGEGLSNRYYKHARWLLERAHATTNLTPEEGGIE